MEQPSWSERYRQADSEPKTEFVIFNTIVSLPIIAGVEGSKSELASG